MLKFALSGLTFLILALSTGRASGHSFERMTLTEAVDRADLIVVATTKRKDEAKFPGPGALVVEKVIKGPTKLKRVEMDHLGIVMSEPITDGTRGVFLLSKYQDRHLFFHPISIQTRGDLAERIKAVQRSQQMLADPVSFMEDAEGELSLDLIYVLGQRLRSFRIHSPQAEALDVDLFNLRPSSSLMSFFPWEVREELRMKLGFKDEELHLSEVDPGKEESQLVQPFKKLMGIVSKSEQAQAVLKQASVITLDTRQPTKVGTLDAEVVRQTLREAIKPNMEYERLEEVLQALAQARDLDAVEAISKLLESKKTYEVRMAARWLGMAGSNRATPALMAYLDTVDPDQKKYNPPASAVAEALYEIGDISVLPTIRERLRAGSHYSALMLGRYGSAADLGLLIEAGAADPSRSSGMQTAMFWLVKRSNRELEDWMVSPRWDGNIGREKQAKWEAWWNTNEAGFEVVRSHEAAFEDNGSAF